MENEKILEMFNDEISRLGNILKTKDPESAEYKKILNDILMLHRMRKVEIDRISGILERDLKVSQMEDLREHNETIEKIERDKLEYQKALDDMKFEREADKINDDNEKTKWERRLKYLDYGLRILELGAPIFAFRSLYKMGLKFEEEGTFTSTTVRNLIGKNKLK